MIDVRQKLYDELVVHHESRADRWHENYNRFTKDINLVKERVQKEDARLSQDSLYQGLSSLSEPSYKGFLWKLIGEKNNGISSRGQSVLSREHLAEFKENPQFEEFLREILFSPLDNDLFLKFNDWWKSRPGVKHNRVLINRIFAACTPTGLSTVVDEGKFNRLFLWLQEEGLIGRYEPPQTGDTWLSRNIFLMKELHAVDRKGLPEEWLNKFPWLLFEYMERKQEQKSVVSQAEMGLACFSQDAFFDAVDSADLTMERSVSAALCAALHSKPFLILTGLSGSGKTHLAMAFTKWISKKETPKNLFSKGTEVRSSRSTYSILDVDRLGVKVGQSGSNSKTFLPFDLIDKWIEAIEKNDFDAATPSQEIQQKVIKSGLDYSPTLNSFHAPLKALAFHQIETAVSNDSNAQYQLISVGADWTSNENLLGYPDALNVKSYRKPDNGALDLILAAQADPENPYFLILDEMNLSHVERYFADFLSAMESGEAMQLHSGKGEVWNGVPSELKIPKNLFVIGTVNVDETTYMFSPKVLDRANVIEFRVSDDEMASFLQNPVKPDLEAIAGQGAGYGKAFVAAASQKNVPIDDELRDQISTVLMKFFPELQNAGAEFGYRSAHEICRFIYFHKDLSGEEWTFDSAMDAAIMQKLLPKLHGSKKKLGPVLASLIRLSMKESVIEKLPDPLKDDILIEGNAKYPVSIAKLKRMRQRLAEHGFTSFAEA